jgi:hypothetical protein
MGLVNSDLANASEKAIALANFYFQRGLEEPLARHIRALERRLFEDGTGVVTIRTAPYRDVKAGKARLRISPNTGVRVPFRYALIAYGIDEAPGDGREPGPTVEDSEWFHHAKPRLALAHEMGHIALGHCTGAGPKGELAVPVNGFEKDQEWAACLYAAHLLWVCGKYVSERHKLLHPSVQAIEDTAAFCWPEFCSSGHFHDAFAYCRDQLPKWEPLDETNMAQVRADLGVVGRKDTIYTTPAHAAKRRR